MHAPKIAEIADAIGEPAELRLTRPPPRSDSGLVPFLWSGQIDVPTIEHFLAAWKCVAFGAVDDDARALAVRRLAEWRLVVPGPERSAPERPDIPFDEDDARVERALALLQALPQQLTLVSRNSVVVRPEVVEPEGVEREAPEPEVVDSPPRRVLQPRAACNDALRSSMFVVHLPEPIVQPVVEVVAPVVVPLQMPVAEPEPVVPQGPPTPPVPSAQFPAASTFPPPLPPAAVRERSATTSIVVQRNVPASTGARVRSLPWRRLAIPAAIVALATVGVGWMPAGGEVAAPADPHPLKVSVNGGATTTVHGLLLPRIAFGRPHRASWWFGSATGNGKVKHEDPKALANALTDTRNDPTGVAKSVSVEGTRAVTDDTMRRSQSLEIGTYVGATFAGVTAHMDGDGVVITVPIGGKKVLKRVTVVDGRPIRTYIDLQNAINTKDPDSDHQFAFDDGTKASVALPSDFRSTRAYGPLGVKVVSVNPRTELDRPVEFPNFDETSGNAAGLTFALATYATLSKTNITHGKKVLAIGDVQPDGSVLGIDYSSTIGKEAADAGVDVLIVPQENLKEAGGYADGVTIVGVTTFAEAVDYLAGM
jgi:hypothetical protein